MAGDIQALRELGLVTWEGQGPSDPRALSATALIYCKGLLPNSLQ